MSTHQLLAIVIKWASEAAKEHVELAIFHGEDPDPETSMGLWQSFQAKFPKTPGVDYDILVNAYSHTFTVTVKTLLAFRPDGGRAAVNRDSK